MFYLHLLSTNTMQVMVLIWNLKFIIICGDAYILHQETAELFKVRSASHSAFSESFELLAGDQGLEMWKRFCSKKSLENNTNTLKPAITTSWAAADVGTMLGEL